jgi:hypothetical protein
MTPLFRSKPENREPRPATRTRFPARRFARVTAIHREKAPVAWKFAVLCLRSRHGVVPEELASFSVERRGTTHERKRIMLVQMIQVKFKLFINCITDRKSRAQSRKEVSTKSHARDPPLMA